MGKLDASHEKYENGSQMLAQLGKLDDDRLNSLRADICRMLGIRDMDAKKVDALQGATIGNLAGALGWGERGGLEDDIKEDPEQYRLVKGIIRSLKETQRTDVKNPVSRDWVGHDFYLGTLKNIIGMLHELGVMLTEVFPGIDPDLENIINLRYFENCAREDLRVLENPFAVGVYQPQSGQFQRSAALNLCPEERLRIAPKSVLTTMLAELKIKFPKGQTPEQINEIFKAEYPEFAELYEKLAKQYLLWRFKRLLVCNVEGRDRGELNEQVKLHVGPDNAHTDYGIGSWLTEVYELGLKPEEILGMKLENMFEMWTYQNDRPATIQGDFPGEYLDLLQRVTKPNYDVKKSDPILAENTFGSSQLDYQLALKNKLLQAGYKKWQFAQLFLRAKQPVSWRKLVPIIEWDGNSKDFGAKYGDWEDKINPHPDTSKP